MCGKPCAKKLGGMIATALATLLTTFAAPPACLPSTVVTAPGVPVAVTTDCDSPGTVAIVDAPVGGSLSGLPGTYTPFAGFHGVDHLTYTVTNGGGETSQQTAINIVVNSLPHCDDGTATTPVDTPL